MKKIVACLSLCFLSLVAFGQTIIHPYDNVIYVYSAEDETPGVKRGTYDETHMLGKEVREIANNIERAYVYYQSTGGAYAMQEKVVNKPAIYNAYQRLDKYYTKGVASGKLSVTDATPEVVEVYSTLLKLLNYETTTVENDLKKIKKPAAIVEYVKSLKFQ